MCVKLVATSTGEVPNLQGRGQEEPGALFQRAVEGRGRRRGAVNEGFWAAVAETACESLAAAALIADDAAGGQAAEFREHALYENARNQTAIVAERLLRRSVAELDSQVVLPGLCEVATHLKARTSAALAHFLRRLGDKAAAAIGGDGRLACAFHEEARLVEANQHAASCPLMSASSAEDALISGALADLVALLAMCEAPTFTRQFPLADAYTVADKCQAPSNDGPC